MDSQIDARLNRVLQRALEQHRLPGLAVVVRQHNDDLLAGSVGYFDAAGLCLVDDQTSFGVASLSKLVTTMLVLLLHERGVLSVDDLLIKYFPSLRVAQSVPITLSHLLSHSAGFPGLPGRFYARNIDAPDDRSGGVGPRGNRKASELLAGLPDVPTIVDAAGLVDLINQLNFEMLAPPGKLLNYSNEGFCLLGGVIEQVMERPYDELVHELIFAPLGMNNSAVGKADSLPSTSLALPLLRDGNGYRVSAFWQAPLFYPAGGCISSARDIARLIGALAADAPLPGLESKKRIAKLRMPVASRPDASIGYGFGVEVQEIDADTTMVWHSGQRAGVSSFMGCLVEQQIAISVLCNVADAPVISIAHELMGQLSGRADICWPPAISTGQGETTVSETLTGRYASDEGNDYVVKVVDDALVLAAPSAPHGQPLCFAGLDYGTVGAQTFRFLREAPQLQAWALALDLRVLRRS